MIGAECKFNGSKIEFTKKDSLSQLTIFDISNEDQNQIDFINNVTMNQPILVIICYSDDRPIIMIKLHKDQDRDNYIDIDDADLTGNSVIKKKNLNIKCQSINEQIDYYLVDQNTIDWKGYKLSTNNHQILGTNKLTKRVIDQNKSDSYKIKYFRLISYPEGNTSVLNRI